MANHVTNWISVYGNADTLKEVACIQNDFIQRSNLRGSTGSIDMAAVGVVLYGLSEETPSPTGHKWVSFEYCGDGVLTFVSANHSVPELQDQLTFRLSKLDQRVITLMEWDDWPQECGVRITFLKDHVLQSFEARSTSSDMIGLGGSGIVFEDCTEDEIDNDRKWSALEKCREDVISKAANDCSWVRKSLLS